jgi:hypothetical protein
MATLYAALGTLPAIVSTVNARRVPYFLGGAAWAAEAMVYLPLLTFALVLPLAAEAAVRERADGSWLVLSVNPLSSAGYLLRRWVAVLPIVVPLTALPLLLAAVLAVVSGAPVAPGHFVWPWLLTVVPVAVASSAIGFGAATIMGGLVGGLAFAAVSWAILAALVGRALFPWRLALAGPGEWLGIENLSLQLQRLSLSIVPRASAAATPGLVEGLPIVPLSTSDAPVDAAVLWRESLHAGAPTLAFGALLLVIAVFYLRRTVPDVSPRRTTSGQSLRTFSRHFHGLRERYTPDAAPARSDRVLLALGLLVVVTGVALHLTRGQAIRRLASRQSAAEQQSWPPPTSPGLVPGRWRLRGELEQRTVDLALEAEMVQSSGGQAGRQIAWVLDPALEVVDLHADRTLQSYERRLDRIAIVLAQPLPPGEPIRLTMRLRGRPGRLDPPVAFSASASPLRAFWRGQQAAAVPGELRDPGLTLAVPALSPTRIDLPAGSLLPVPRYAPFAYTPYEPALGGGGLAPDDAFPPAALDVELRSPQTVLLVDACGSVAAPARGAVLRSTCNLSPAHYVVAGGPQRPLPRSDLRAAVLPSHREAATTFLSTVGEAQRLLDQIWPDDQALSESFTLEWPDDPGRREWARWRPWFRAEFGSALPQVRIDHRLIRVPESYLAGGGVLKPDDLIPPLLAPRLATVRPFAEKDRLLLRNLLSELIEQLAGKLPAQGAVIGPTQFGAAAYRLAGAQAIESSGYWSRRFPQLVVDLRHRVGDEPLRRAFFAELAEKGAEPLTLERLFGRLEGRELPLFLEQLLRGASLPELALGEVTAVRVNDGWSVRGRVVNDGDGNAVCPLRVVTELAPVDVEVTVERDGAFDVFTRHRPQAALLDPDGRCFRYRTSQVARERVDLAKETGG